MNGSFIGVIHTVRFWLYSSSLPSEFASQLVSGALFDSILTLG